MPTSNGYTLIGYDKNVIPRVSATDANYDVAETMVYEEAIEYVKRRPDTGPLSLWIFQKDGQKVG